MALRIERKWIPLPLVGAVGLFVWVGLGGCSFKDKKAIDLIPVVDYRHGAPVVVRYEKMERGTETDAVLRGYYDFAFYKDGRLVELGWGLSDVKDYRMYTSDGKP